MKSKKLVGRVAVVKGEQGEYLTRVIVVRVRNGAYSDIYLRFDAQANKSEPDRFYALKITSNFDVTEYGFHDRLAFASRLIKAMEKETSPRASLHEGKAILVNCEVSQFLQGCEKLGLHVSWFDNWRAGYGWAENLREEESKAGAA